MSPGGKAAVGVKYLAKVCEIEDAISSYDMSVELEYRSGPWEGMQRKERLGHMEWSHASELYDAVAQRWV